MVLGGYYLTYSDRTSSATTPRSSSRGRSGSGSEEEVELAVDAKQVGLQDPIEYRRRTASCC